MIRYIFSWPFYPHTVAKSRFLGRAGFISQSRLNSSLMASPIHFSFGRIQIFNFHWLFDDYNANLTFCCLWKDLIICIFLGALNTWTRKWTWLWSKIWAWQSVIRCLMSMSLSRCNVASIMLSLNYDWVWWRWWAPSPLTPPSARPSPADLSFSLAICCLYQKPAQFVWEMSPKTLITCPLSKLTS